MATTTTQLVEAFQDWVATVVTIAAQGPAGPPGPVGPQGPPGSGNGPTQSGWHTENLQATNDAANPATTMDMAADFLVLWDPVAKASAFVSPVPALRCQIDIIGAGGRDAATPYAIGADVWFYYINGTAGLATICSLNPPSIGPVFPAGYTAYTPAFVCKIFSGPSIYPLLPQGGSSTIKVTSRKVTYENTPMIQGAGYPTMAFDFSNWIPTAHSSVTIYGDIEMHGGTAVIGGAVMSTSLGNIFNASLYPQQAQWDKWDGNVETVLPADRNVTVTFMHSSGIPDNAVAYLGPVSFGF